MYPSPEERPPISMASIRNSVVVALMDCVSMRIQSEEVTNYPLVTGEQSELRNLLKHRRSSCPSSETDGIFMIEAEWLRLTILKALATGQ
jgi:hypothetical protein